MKNLIKTHHLRDETWIEAEEAAGPANLLKRKGRARWAPLNILVRIRARTSLNIGMAPAQALGLRTPRLWTDGYVYVEDGVLYFKATGRLR